MWEFLGGREPQQTRFWPLECGTRIELGTGSEGLTVQGVEVSVLGRCDLLLLAVIRAKSTALGVDFPVAPGKMFVLKHLIKLYSL